MKVLRSTALLRPLRNQVFPRSTVNTPIPRKDNSAESIFFSTNFAIYFFLYIIDRKVNPGSQAPHAYPDTYEYPLDYQPWTFNYKGYGVMLALFSMTSFGKDCRF